MWFRFVCLSTLLAATPAAAFEIETPVSESCHEELTLAAADASQFPNFAMAPAATDEERRAMNDLVFTLRHKDPWTLALLIGVRSNDLEDRAPTDLGTLYKVHDDPAKQDRHCIRREMDDGSEGDVGALAACKAFIMGELEAGGLLDDELDLVTTEPVKSFFRFRGVYTIQLPRFAYRLGRAVHAMEDGYAHAMRDPDTGNVRSVLNWVDAFGGNNYDADRDGYPHLSGLDNCRRSDDVQVARMRHAREAATNLFAAAAMQGAGRRARVEAAVDAALILIPNCTPENDYCNAPELSESTDLRAFGCSAGTSGSLGGVFLVMMMVLATRRRRAIGAGALVVGLALLPQVARADDPAPAPKPEEPAKPELSPEEAAKAQALENVKTDAEAEAAVRKDEAPRKDAAAEIQDRSDILRWHFDGRAGGSWDDPAIAGALGIGVDYKKWSFAILGEWNPWMSFDRVGSTRPGVANLYTAVSYRWYHSSKIALATRVEVGASMMLFELLGIDKYTTGIYLGGALTTVRFPLSKRASITFDPIHFSMPAPRPFGLPFFYKQYRVTVGFEIALTN